MNARAQAEQRVTQLRWLTLAGNAVAETVGNGVTSHAVVFPRAEQDTSYGVMVNPSWSTTVRVAPADKTTTGFTARFGTAAGATDTIDWLTFRSE